MTNSFQQEIIYLKNHLEIIHDHKTTFNAIGIDQSKFYTECMNMIYIIIAKIDSKLNQINDRERIIENR